MKDAVTLIEALCDGENSPELRLRWSKATKKEVGHYSVRLYEHNLRKVAHGKSSDLVEALVQASKQRRGQSCAK